MSSNIPDLDTLYEQAISLVQQELSLLDKEDIDALSEITQKRECLINAMWAMRHACDEEKLLGLLQELQVAQQKLITKATVEQDSLRGRLKVRKKQSGYFANAQKQMAHSDKAFYMNKVS